MSMMLIDRNRESPWHLTPADAIPSEAVFGLFSPSEPLTPPRKAVLDRSLELLTRQGYHIKFAPNALAQGSYSAGPWEDRVSDIHALADDPEVDALMATWGGKSCNQLISHLDFARIANSRKPILGFSDVAVILNALTLATQMVSFHHLVAGRLPETRHADLSLIRNTESARNDVFDFETEGFVRHLFRPGSGQGRLFGGNLSTFVLGLVGSRFLDLLPEDIVFFWESASESPQLIDQHLTTLRNAGILEHVRAMIIGSVYAGHEVAVADIGEAMTYAVRDYDFPILYSPTFGHLPTQNPIVPIGALCAVNSAAFTAKLIDPVIAHR